MELPQVAGVTILGLLLVGSSVSTIIVNSGIVAKTILAILTVLSVVSWAITIDKVYGLSRCKRDNKRLMSYLHPNRSILDVRRFVSKFPNSNLRYLIEESLIALEREMESLNNQKPTDPHSIALKAKSAMERKALQRIQQMERNLSFLATTASVSPFLGLLGTVWGVMQSFLSMGRMGSASLTVVGPGIAEALITTVFGLGAAIPAVVAYNWCVNFVRRESADLEAFISRVMDEIEREIANEALSSRLPV